MSPEKAQNFNKLKMSSRNSLATRLVGLVSKDLPVSRAVSCGLSELKPFSPGLFSLHYNLSFVPSPPRCGIELLCWPFIWPLYPFIIPAAGLCPRKCHSSDRKKRKSHRRKSGKRTKGFGAKGENVRRWEGKCSKAKERAWRHVLLFLVTNLNAECFRWPFHVAFQQSFQQLRSTLFYASALALYTIKAYEWIEGASFLTPAPLLFLHVSLQVHLSHSLSRRSLAKIRETSQISCVHKHVLVTKSPDNSRNEPFGTVLAAFWVTLGSKCALWMHPAEMNASGVWKKSRKWLYRLRASREWGSLFQSQIEANFLGGWTLGTAEICSSFI